MRTKAERARRRNFSRRLHIIIGCSVIIVFLVALFVVGIQTRVSFRDVSADLSRGLDSLCENYQYSQETKKNIVFLNDRIY